MCSIGDDNLEDLENLKYMPVKEKLSTSTKCNKCREGTPIVVLRSKDKYCKECFLAGTVHKFKALLGKHKLIRPKDRVLILHKCGHPSTALLHFIRTGIDLESHKKLRFEPIILFIEDHLDLTLRERQDLLKSIEREAVQFKFPIFSTSLVQLMKAEVVGDVLKEMPSFVELCPNDEGFVDNFVDKQFNVTRRTDFLNILRQNFLLDIAKHLNCKFIFTPEISSDVAAQLITDVSLGRGSHIALNSGFCDSRDEIVKILRPLRFFDMKELAFYNFLNYLEPVTFRLASNNPYHSIQQLMKKFVTDLQVNYPATVTTILKTGDKLALGGTNSKKCDLCNVPIDDENSQLTSAESTRFSHWVSTQSSDSSITSQEHYKKTVEAFNNLTCDSYCFGCKNLMQ